MAAITSVACTKSEEDVATIIGLIGAILGKLQHDSAARALVRSLYPKVHAGRILHVVPAFFLFLSPQLHQSGFLPSEVDALPPWPSFLWLWRVASAIDAL